MDPFSVLVIIVLGILGLTLLTLALRGRNRDIGTAGRRLTRREERVARAEIRKMLENAWGAICDGADRVQIVGGYASPYIVEAIYDYVGPAFEVYWRTAANQNARMNMEYPGGILVIERDPSMQQQVIGIPTEDGSIIVDPTNEPAWITNARFSGWEIIYDNKLNPNGTVNVRYRKLSSGRSWGWRW